MNHVARVNPPTRRRPASRGRTPDGRPNPIDIHVGARVRLRRTLLGISQEKLGEALGLTFQQVQKYERGANRIGSSRLFDLSRVLDVPVSFFFDDMPAEVMAASPARIAEGAEAPAPFADNGRADRLELEMMRAFRAIPDAQRRVLFNLAKSMTGLGAEG